MNIGFIMLILVFFLFISLSVVVFLKTSDSSSLIVLKIKKESTKIIAVCMGLLLLIFLLDLIGVFTLGGYRFLPLWSEIIGALSIVYSKCKISEKYKPICKFIVRSFTICFFLEMFVFNFNSAHLLSENYSEGNLDLNNAVVENFDIYSGQSTASGTSSIEFKNLNMPVGTLNIDGESNLKSSVNFSISITDETNSASYRNGIASMQVIRNSTRSQTIPCNFSGKVYNMKISFNLDEGEIVTIKNISVNNQIMLHISLLRFLIMFIGSIIIYACMSEQYLFKSYSDRKLTVKISAWAMTAVIILSSLFITNMGRYLDDNHSLKKDFTLKSGNQISQEIVDAFEDGRTNIDIPMNENLLNLNNPYDWSQRNDIGSYPWDHLLYNGKYYSYYGIGPVLALFLPYHLITGYYFPSCWACWLFGALGIFFLTKFYLCFVDKFFSKVKASLLLIGLLIMQLSTGIYFCYFITNFYEIAQSSGFLCVTAGAFFLISSNVIGDGKIKNWRLVMSAFCLSMGVLCRPTLAVYCLASLLFIYAGLKKKKSVYDSNTSKAKYYVPYLLCSLLPFALIGSIQIWYNYARFGNPFDFGIQYSLTINDFTNAQYHTHFVLIGFFNYLFTLPIFSEKFPFFNAGNALTFNPQGYYFIATGAALGLIWRALPIVAYEKSICAYRTTQNKNKRLYSLLVLATCIICPFAIIFSVWESGYGTRYCVDFAWQLIIGALIICFIIYDKCRENTQKHLNKLMIGSGLLCLIMNFIQVYSYLNPVEKFNTVWQANILEFSRLFEFWR